MPEGHSLHRIARDHQRDFAGQQLAVSSPQGRFAHGSARLDGAFLTRVEAYGKHLFYWWDAAPLLHVHLGLYGKFRPHMSPPPEPQGQVRLRVVGPERAFDLHGPAACELLDEPGRRRILARLGPDPLRDDADGDVVWSRLSRSRAALGKLLLDQSVLAGVGNVYRAEALHALGIHPELPGRQLSREQFDRLWKWLRAQLRIGVRHNRIITADPQRVGKPRSRMRRDERLLVSRRDICGTCGGAVESWDLGARTIYACIRCQPIANRSLRGPRRRTRASRPTAAARRS